MRGYFEDYVPPRPRDAVEMGFVLEHVADPAALVAATPASSRRAAFSRSRSRTRARCTGWSGQRAGLLADLYQLSEHDLALGHRRYFDREWLRRLIGGAGLRVRPARASC